FKMHNKDVLESWKLHMVNCQTFQHDSDPKHKAKSTLQCGPHSLLTSGSSSRVGEISNMQFTQDNPRIYKRPLSAGMGNFYHLKK
uniref:Uncharacterized protein n=1 Tax=Pygocentrus nattereri TaxID=42514 RepID=A0AAR2KJI6_PYGNA